MSSSAMLVATNSRNNGRRDASNTAPVLGQSLSNFTGRKRAIALFDGMSHIMNYIKLEQLTLAVVAGGGMECIVRKLLTGCASVGKAHLWQRHPARAPWPLCQPFPLKSGAGAII